jgi:hypothetical protein
MTTRPNEPAQEKFERLIAENETYVDDALKAGIVPKFNPERFKAAMEAFMETCSPALEQFPRPFPSDVRNALQPFTLYPVCFDLSKAVIPGPTPTLESLNYENR